jgi:RNA-dependent RNA polymerase
MKDNDVAIEMLDKFRDEQQSHSCLADLLRAEFKTETLQEPFVVNLINLWRSWSIKSLKEKAHILVQKSAFVLGCVDETETLRGHSFDTERTKEKDVDRLPQIFLQVSDPKNYNKTCIIRGVCIVGRNPSLHPGDIRVVEAVDCEALHHLKDVVVFPSTGDRPVPNMLSGGDLDGDDFFVIWEPSLIPSEWNYPPMNYSPPKPIELERHVGVNDLRNFFVKYLKNDKLPLIAIAHLAFSDELGPKSPKCKSLTRYLWECSANIVQVWSLPSYTPKQWTTLKLVTQQL